MLETLFPHEVVAVAAEGALWDAEALPGECLEGAGERRRREFAVGRACAREALARLGVEPAAIPRGPDRAPCWPPGVVGSITHCRGFCAAAVARQTFHAGVGLDAERRGRVTPAILARVASEAEREGLAALPGPLEWPTLLWSAKESLRKCVASATGRLPAPSEMQVRFAPGAETGGAFEACLAPGFLEGAMTGSLAGRYACDAEVVVTGIALPAPA